MISGVISLIKSGAGTMTFSGNNTYSGGTTVSGGTLIGNTTSLQGNILNNASLLFLQNFNGQFNGSLRGLGAMLKRGTGTLLLTGDNPFSGTVAVDQGVLQVGSRAARASLGGHVTVANGAGLSGNGSVGSVVNHGVVASGSEAGTLSVAGNLTNASDGLLALTPEGEVIEANHIAFELLSPEGEVRGGVLMLPALAGLGAPHWRPDALAALLDARHAWPALRERARSHVRDRHDWARNIRRYQDVYQLLLTRRADGKLSAAA